MTVSPPRHALFSACLAAMLGAGVFSGCAGPRDVSEPGEKPALTADELRTLLQQHTIQPVNAVEGDDPNAPIDPTMQDYADPAKAAALVSDPQGAGAEPAAPKPAPELPAENPYLVFGERIKVNPDGTITKPFPLRNGTGEKLRDLIVNYGNFPLWTETLGPGPSTPNTVKLDLLAGWDVELYQDLRAPGAAATPAPLADWLVVTAGADLLSEVEDFINLFAAGVPQIEIEAKVVEIALSDILDVGIKPVTGKPIFDAPGSNTFVRGLDYTLPNAADGVEALLTLGSIQDGLAFNAIIEAVQGRQNVSIINQPKIAVREGSRAEISSITRVPYLAIQGINATGGYGASIAYQEVGVKLYVIPRVVGTQTVALNIDIEASQQTGSAVALVASTGEEVQTPVLSTRAAKTIVYLQPGQAVILGGLITERTVDRVNKVPLLGDIPILQYLFRSTTKSKEQTNVLFFIRPRILQGVDLHRQF
ncbi:MAG: type II and III secretion system protein [Planctomycetes bacterium]|jgi:type II secretory pathway component GspD/PulD (secretin)|nr:type II and III secretion system protein [Planctomycetota bacterium]